MVYWIKRMGLFRDTGTPSAAVPTAKAESLLTPLAFSCYFFQ